MTETAVGLFENAEIANDVVGALHDSGLSASGIKIVSQGSGAAVDGVTSTPASDMAVALGRDLREMGATERESELYVAGLARGNALVFASGTPEQVSIANDVMNDYFAIAVEDFEGSAPVLEPVVAGSVGGPDVTEKIEHHRNRTEGAKVFTW